MSFARCVSALLATTVIVANLAAQTTTGRIQGRITDESGASIPNVKVGLVNEDTGVGRQTSSNDTGDYTFLEVPVGNYSLSFDVSGFQKNVRRGVTVLLNQVLTLDAVLKIGTASEVIDVTSEAPLVDTSTSQLGAVVGDRAVSNLPLNARDTYQLLQLQPGVQGVGGTDLFAGSNQAGAVSVNGGRGRANNFSVNGGDGNDLFVNGPAIQPSPDSIQEFRVLTNTFDAEYGRNSGAVINVVTKSGTNHLHGNMYEFFRNKALNAKAYLDPFKADNKQNVFGGTLGGPIRKDRTFFFGSYEGRRNIQGVSSDPVFVPTQAQRGGNFSDTPFTGTLNSPIMGAILQQRCGALLGAAPTMGTSWSAIFPNSVIPTQCMDPVAVDLMNRYVPLPNQGGNLWQDVPIGRTRDDQFTAKVDHKLSDKQSLNIYYYFIDSNQRQPFTRFEALTPNLLPGFGNQSLVRDQQWNVSHTWTLGPSSVNQFRFTYFREAQGTFLHPQHTNLVTNSCSSSVAAFCFTGTTDTPTLITPDPKLGITPNLGPNHEGVPFIQIFGGFTIGNDYEGELPQIGNTFQWSDNVTKVAGKHTLKFGGDIRRMRFDQMLFFDPNGDFSYTPGATSSPGASNLFPDYLLGLPSSYLQGSAQQEHIRSTAIYLFAQDSWKVKPSLTLNYGLRWELNTPLTDVGQRVQTFRAGQADTIFPCVLSASNPLVATYGSADCSPTGPANAVYPLGLVIPGDRGIPGGLTQTYYKSLAPRIGLAWSPNWNSKLTGGPGRMSVRMGYGIFYNPVEQLVLEQFQGEPPFGGSSSISGGLFTTPFVSQSCDPTAAPCSVTNGSSPNPFNGVLDPKRGSPVDWSVFRPIAFFGELQPNIRSQYAEQYNLSIERELTNSMVMTVSYVGSQGHRLLATHDLNFSNPQSCLDLMAFSNNDPTSVLGAPGGSPVHCAQTFEDASYFIPPTAIVPPGMTTLHLPYGAPNGGGPFNLTVTPGQPISSVAPNGITLVGLRRYSSPFCQPLTGTGCPADGIPVFVYIFAQDTVSNSNYNSLQLSVERRMSKGLQFLAAYTFSKSIDNASTFEEILNPFDPRADRSLSLFDARHRFVFSYMWELPVPKYTGGKGKALNGWAVSGITTFQSGFPIRLISNNDQELMYSFDFNLPGRPDLVAPFTHQDPRSNGNYYFDPNLFTDPALGSLGNSPRAICCGPGINNFDIAIHKLTSVSERVGTEFRAEFFNAFNHTQFLNPDGNISDKPFYFGRVLHTRDPRLIQLAFKLNF